MPLPRNLHPQCMSIKILQEDPYISSQNCMSFARSKVGTDLSCNFGQAEQVNRVFFRRCLRISFRTIIIFSFYILQLNSNTHYMDGSQIYGSDLMTSYDLRSGVDGLLKTSNVEGRQLLPIAPGCEEQVNRELAVCFQAGKWPNLFTSAWALLILYI